MSYVTEIVWPLGFADITFPLERSDDRQYMYVCVRGLGKKLLQFKIEFRLNFFNLGWFSISLVS